MSPTVFISKKFRFSFNSREEERMHVHIQTPDGVAKANCLAGQLPQRLKQGFEGNLKDSGGKTE